METVLSSEMLANFYNTKWRDFPEETTFTAVGTSISRKSI
jgi:hypothetical protein